MSGITVLGIVGTALTTIFMVPHLMNAIRVGAPSGTPFAWALTALQSGVWVAYGLASRDVLMAASGFVVVPIGVTLAVWCWMIQRRVGVVVISPPSQGGEHGFESRTRYDSDGIPGQMYASGAVDLEVQGP